MNRTGNDRPRVVVAGLGPAGAELITAQTRAVIDAAPVSFVRTTHHPAVGDLTFTESFDHLYERHDTFDAVYREIVEQLVAGAVDSGSVVYVVPGSPRVLERSVDLLLRDDRVVVEVLPAMSFLDVAWARLGIDPIEARVTLVDGHVFTTAAAGLSGPLLVAHCHNQRVLSDIKLAVDNPGDEPVTVLQRLGSPDERVFQVAWEDLDREVQADHLTSLYIGSVASPIAAELTRFDELVRTLRRECPWDSAQTHMSLRRHLIEESYEVLAAIEAFDPVSGVGADDLEEELGDLLFQVFLHSAMAAESGWFELVDVARSVHDKLWQRHPHVFADAEFGSVDELVSSWESNKLAEKNRQSVTDGIPAGLPALAFAEKLVKKADVVGVTADQTTDRASRQPGERAIGELLFELVLRARDESVDPEMALRSVSRDLQARIRRYERLAAESDIDVISISRLDAIRLWRLSADTGDAESA